MTTSALWLVAASLLLARAAPPDVLGFTSMESPQHVAGEPRVTISYPRPSEPRVASTSSMLLEVHAYALRQSGIVIYWDGLPLVPDADASRGRRTCGVRLTGNVHCYLRLGNLGLGKHSIEVALPNVDGSEPWGRWSTDVLAVSDGDERLWRHETLSLPWGASIRMRSRVEGDTVSSQLASMIREGFYDVQSLRLQSEYVDGAVASAGEVCEGDIIIDIGGHVGLSAIAFATKFPNARVLVFEPIPQTYEDLVWNIAANNLSHAITPQRAAVVAEAEGGGAKAGTVELKYVPYQSSGSLTSLRAEAWWWHDHLETVTAPTESLPAILRRHQVQRVRFLKLDCEGCEFDVIGALDHVEPPNEAVDLAPPPIIPTLPSPRRPRFHLRHPRRVNGVLTWERRRRLCASAWCAARYTPHTQRRRRSCASWRPFLRRPRRHGAAPEKIGKRWRDGGSGSGRGRGCQMYGRSCRAWFGIGLPSWHQQRKVSGNGAP